MAAHVTFKFMITTIVSGKKASMKATILVLVCLLSGFPIHANCQQNVTDEYGMQDQLSKLQKAHMETRSKWLQCMAVRKMAYLATNYETKAIAFLLSEGQSITLDSWLCLLPDQNDKVTVRWKFLAIDGAELSFIEQDGSKYFVQQGSKSLEITDVKREDTGFYFANVNYEHDSAVYFVEVSDTEVFADVSRYTADTMYEPPEHILQSRNLRVTVRMSEWSLCSRCDRIGIQQRFGVCIVEPYNYTEPIKPVHYPVMDMFLGGLPCRSAFLPKEFRDMTEVKSTDSVYVKGFCEIPCPKETELADKRLKGIGGRLSQIATNLLQRMLKARTVVQAKNEGTGLVCPEKNRLGQPIVWRKDDQLLSPTEIQAATTSRILIDHTGRIRIERLQMKDSGSYSCWIGDQLVGTVKLVVKDRFVPPTRAMLSILSYLVVVIVLIVLGSKMWLGRNNRAITFKNDN